MYAPASAGAYKTHSDLMTRIKHLLFALLLAVAVTSPANAFDLPDEDLNYIVLYKWGLINKDAASATLSLRSDGSDYSAQLAASTLPWADKVFRVRDTLQVRIQKSGCLPQVYRKITHEGGTYNRDVVRYSRVGNEVTGHATRVRQKNDGPVMRFDTTLYATGPTFDMLSIFYYLRQFDYPAMSVGSQIHASLFSGKNVEQITVTYRGTQRVKIKGRQWDAYYLTFSFTHKGKPTGETMYTWISTDAQRIPLKVEGKLPLGKVQALYTGGPE